MYRNTIVLISRAEKFSPNNVENDKMILEEVGRGLMGKGFQVCVVSEDDMACVPDSPVYVSMGRSEEVLLYLSQCQDSGSIIVNSPKGVSLCCQRAKQMRRLEDNGVPVAPHEGSDGYWVKRGDGYTMVREDVVFAADMGEAAALAYKMRQRGITEVDIRAHVMGDLVKFYGVNGTGFFRYYYPADDGLTKFDHELRNGTPSHIPFDESALRRTASHAAVLLDVDIYGGDAIIQPDGTAVLIDFNDWPGFSRCREEAAQAIVQLIEQRIKR